MKEPNAYDPFVRIVYTFLSRPPPPPHSQNFHFNYLSMLILDGGRSWMHPNPTKEQRVWFSFNPSYVRPCMLFKEEQSANKFRKFADLNNLLDLLTFRKLDTLRICDLWVQFLWSADPFEICRLKTSVSSQIHTFSLTNVAFNALISNLYIKKSLQRRLLGLFWDRVFCSN